MAADVLIEGTPYRALIKVVDARLLCPVDE